MTADEARDRFSDALEGELSGERKAEFEAALESDETLRSEYKAFVETFQSMGRIANADEEEAPDLLRGVQDRLRKRSKGRFYRDRFAARAGGGWALPLLLGGAMLVILVIAWILLQTTIVLEPPRGSAPTSESR